MFINSKTISIARMVPYLIVSLFTNAFEAQAASLSLPQMQDELGISVALSQWFSSVSIVTKAAFSMILANYGISLGAKLSLCICQVICAGMCVLIVFCKNFWQLLLVKVALSAAQTCAMQCSQFLVQNLLPDDKSARLNFMRQQRIVVSLLNASSPLIVSQVTEHFGWKINYAIVAVGCTLRSIFVGFCFERIQRQQSNSSFLNHFLLALILLSVSLGFTMLSFQLLFWASMLIVLGIPLTAIFIYCESSSRNRIFNMNKQSQVSYGLAAILALMGTVQACEGLITPQFFANEFGGIEILGFVNSGKSLASFGVIILVQMLLQRKKLLPTKIAYWCSLFSTCCVLLSLAGSFNIWAFTSFYALRGVSSVPIMITLRPIMVVLVPKETMHKITSLSSTMQTLGSCLVRALCGMILHIASAKYNGNEYWRTVALCYILVTGIAIATFALIAFILAKNRSAIDNEDTESNLETQSLVHDV